MKLNNEFTLGQLVYLLHDPERYIRQVVSINAGINGITYSLQCGTEVSEHYADEITTTKPVE